MATLNTTIILRNDLSANWLANSSVILAKGEVGIEFLADGKAKMKIGDGVKTWAQLSYFGGETAKYFEVVPEVGADGSVEIHVDAINRVVGNATLSGGDIAIVKETFAPKKTLYSAYVYDEVAGEWRAMEGNYRADNVYTTEDLTLAGEFDTVGNYKKGNVIAAGTSLQDVLSDMLQQELYPTAEDKPSASISVKGNSGEVGNSYTLPTATLTIDDVGSYQYGDKATGITFAIGSVTLSQGVNSISNTTVMANKATLDLQATDTATLYTDSAKTYTFSGTASYEQAPIIPVTNLGNPYEAARIPAGEVSIVSKTATFTGYRYSFAGGTAEETVNSAVIRGLTKKKKTTDSVVTAKGDSGILFTASKGDTKAIFAYPSSWTSKTPKFELYTMSWGATEGFVESTVNVADYRGGENGLVEYKVYTFTPATPFAADETKYSVHFE